jgi:hypothetical protein
MKEIRFVHRPAPWKMERLSHPKFHLGELGTRQGFYEEGRSGSMGRRSVPRVAFIIQSMSALFCSRFFFLL